MRWSKTNLRLHAGLIVLLSILIFNSNDSSDAADGGDPGQVSAPKKKSRYQRSKLTSDESEQVADKRRLLLTTGEDKVIDLDFQLDKDWLDREINYGNTQAIKVEAIHLGDKWQVVFKPLKVGETTVTLRDIEGSIKTIFTVRVTGSNLLRIAGEIRDLIRDIEGIDIRIVGPKVIVEGELIVPQDWGKLFTVIHDKSYSDFVLNLSTLSPLSLQVMANKIQDDINAGGAPNVKTRIVNGTIFLEGSVDNLEQATRALKIANFYLPDNKPGFLGEGDSTLQRLPAGRRLIESFILVNPPPPRKAEKMIRITAHFVDLSKDYNKLFGFKWQPGFTSDPQIAIGQTQAGAAGASNGASFSGTISSLLPKLASVQAAGYARILKTATVIVRSGLAASVSEQTQIPFIQASTGGTATSGKESVGLSLSVSPRIVGQTEDVQLRLKLKQTSMVGRGPSTGAPPITSLHNIETDIYVRSGESAAVGGVISSDIGTDFNKDDPAPGSFGQGTDPLFTLLRSKGYRKKKSQFVIFITPQIIENASDGTEDLKRNFRVKVK